MMAAAINHIAIYWDACRAKQVAELRAMREALRERRIVWRKFLAEDAEPGFDGPDDVYPDDGSFEDPEEEDIQDDDMRPEIRERNRVDWLRMMALERLISWRLDNPEEYIAPPYGSLRTISESRAAALTVLRYVAHLRMRGESYKSKRQILRAIDKLRNVGPGASARVLDRYFQKAAIPAPSNLDELYRTVSKMKIGAVTT